MGVRYLYAYIPTCPTHTLLASLLALAKPLEQLQDVTRLTPESLTACIDGARQFHAARRARGSDKTWDFHESHLFRVQRRPLTLLGQPASQPDILSNRSTSMEYYIDRFGRGGLPRRPWRRGTGRDFGTASALSSSLAGRQLSLVRLAGWHVDRPA